MTPISRITFIENARRVEALNSFLGLLATYLEGTTFGRISEPPRETDEAKEARTKINKMSEEVSEMIYAAGYSPVVQWGPDPVTGSPVQNLHLLRNFFNLGYYRVQRQTVFDVIERACGNYERNHKAAVIRTFNPFSWLGRFIAWIGGLPFHFFSHLGLDREKLEVSVIGRIFRGLVEVAAGLITIATLLQMLGYLDPFLKAVGIKQ